MKNLKANLVIENYFFVHSVYTDYIRLKQILMNIILNSIQFSEEGFINVNINILSSKPFLIEISIVDEGIGMDEKFLENLQNKINEENDSQKLNSTGSCMGLRISQKIVKVLGGEIMLYSNLDQGTTVKFAILDQKTDIFHNKTNIFNELEVERSFWQKPRTDQFELKKESNESIKIYSQQIDIKKKLNQTKKTFLKQSKAYMKMMVIF